MNTIRILTLALLAVGLGQSGLRADDDGDVKALLKDLKSPDAKTRWTAAKELGALGPKAKAAIPALVAAMEDGELNVRSYSSAALSQIGKDALPALQTALATKSADRRKGAFDALIRMGGDAAPAIPAIVRATDDLDYRDVLKGLKKIGPAPKESAGPLAAVLNRKQDGNANVGLVKKAAIEALEAMGPAAKDALGAMVAMMKTTADPDFLLHTQQAIANVGPDAIPALTTLMGDKDSEIRYRTMVALSKMSKDDRAPAAPVLLTSLLDKQETIRVLAQVALHDIKPDESLVPALIKVLKGEDKKLHNTAAILLEKLGPKGKDAAPQLAVGLKDDDYLYRRTMMKTLLALGEGAKEAEEAIRSATADPDQFVSAWAKKSLTELKGKK